MKLRTVNDYFEDLKKSLFPACKTCGKKYDPISWGTGGKDMVMHDYGKCPICKEREKCIDEILREDK